MSTPRSERSQSAYRPAHLSSVMAAVVEGDAGAFDELYRLTVPLVHAVARRVVWCEEDAQEIVAEVFVFVWRHARRFDAARGSVAGWLAMVARRRAIDVLRKKIATVSLDDEKNERLRTSLTEAPAPDAEVMFVQEATSIHAALGTLSPLRQRIIMLAFFRGLTHAEIADSMSMSLGTVKSHVRRGLAAMRGSLSGFAAPLAKQFSAVEA